MKIAIFSDPHCGFDEKGREKDWEIALKEAVEKSLDADLILIAGDIFDTRVPKQDVFAKVAKILLEAHKYPSRAKFVEIKGREKKDLNPLSFRGIPIITIYGNHERRSRQLINPVEALEHAGIVVNLHASTIVFEIEGKKVAIHGLSSVPERYARDAFLQWNPKPIEDAVNILMIHQSVGEYIYSPLEPPTLQLEDLPEGFDLYILGHLHWVDLRDFKGGRLLLPGSLYPTVPKKDEAKHPKGVWFFDGKELTFEPLKFQRKLYFEKLECSPNVKTELRKLLSEKEEGSIVYVKILGSCNESFRDIFAEFEDKLILKIKTELKEKEEEERAKLLEIIREQRMSPDELGIQLLKTNLERNGITLKIEDIFDYLIDGDVDGAFDVLLEEKVKEHDQ